MNDVEKYEAIEALFEKHLRPALMSDGGNIELDLVKGNEVIVSFQGACGSCPSSAGATLQGIERAIQQHVFKEAVVLPTNVISEVVLSETLSKAIFGFFLIILKPEFAFFIFFEVWNFL